MSVSVKNGKRGARKLLDKLSSRRTYLFRQLRRQNLHLLNAGWLGKQFGGFGHKSRCDLSCEMSLPACVVRKRIEDAEGFRAQANTKPCGCGRFLLDQGQASAEKLFHLCFFSRLCFQPDK